MIKYFINITQYSHSEQFKSEIWQQCKIFKSEI